MHTITVLHVPGCSGGRAALGLARSIADERDDVLVADSVVEAGSDAVTTTFRGSPTVLIDGGDIDPDPQTPIGSMG